MGSHLIDGEFQSDKYPTTPRGKVPLSVRDPAAQDLLWEYAQRRRPVDAEFSADLESALRAEGHDPELLESAERERVRIAFLQASRMVIRGSSLIDDMKDRICSMFSSAVSPHLDDSLLPAVARRLLRVSGVRALREAEELRAGIELVAALDPNNLDSAGVQGELRDLLDRVDARDSLAHLESGALSSSDVAALRSLRRYLGIRCNLPPDLDDDGEASFLAAWPSFRSWIALVDRLVASADGSADPGSRPPSPRSWDPDAADRGSETRESSDYVDGWNDAIAEIQERARRALRVAGERPERGG